MLRERPLVPIGSGDRSLLHLLLLSGMILAVTNIFFISLLIVTIVNFS